MAITELHGNVLNHLTNSVNIPVGSFLGRAFGELLAWKCYPWQPASQVLTIPKTDYRCWGRVVGLICGVIMGSRSRRLVWERGLRSLSTLK